MEEISELELEIKNINDTIRENNNRLYPLMNKLDKLRIEKLFENQLLCRTAWELRLYQDSMYLWAMKDVPEFSKLFHYDYHDRITLMDTIEMNMNDGDITISTLDGDNGKLLDFIKFANLTVDITDLESQRKFLKNNIKNSKNALEKFNQQIELLEKLK